MEKGRQRIWEKIFSLLFFSYLNQNIESEYTHDRLIISLGKEIECKTKNQ